MPAACFSTSAPKWAVVPLPPEPKESGRPSVFCCWASAISSVIVPTLSVTGTTTTLGAVLMRLIGAKLRVG